MFLVPVASGCHDFWRRLPLVSAQVAGKVAQATTVLAQVPTNLVQVTMILAQVAMILAQVAMILAQVPKKGCYLRRSKNAKG